MMEAEPLTGRTHQIRVHAADKGFPILGDTLYGGSPAGRVFLHAAELTFKHPATGEDMTFKAPANFEAEPRSRLRAALIDPEVASAYRLIHGASDGWAGWYVDRLGEYLLSQSEEPLKPSQQQELNRLLVASSALGAYHKLLTQQVRRTSSAQASPRPMLGEPAPESFNILENGMRFELSFQEGYSTGIFLDQRDNRRRLLTAHIAADFPLVHPSHDTRHPPPEILNTFAYTCGFSVCAAKAGARTTSLDLSKKHLECGKRNFALNDIDVAGHEFIYGDVFDWLRRWARKRRLFDAVLVDPPTFSQSKEYGAFRVEKDYGKLISAALPVLKPGGALFASTNAATWPPESFIASVEGAVRAAKRRIVRRHYAPQPPDFPVSKLEPAYLKTVWLRIE
jgi:23S rRNA (cytosine1962-C5)-methyltransferase